MIINIVYGHIDRIKQHQRGSVKIIWSPLPIAGCDHYAYHNAFSYRGKLPGKQILIMLEPHVVQPGEYSDAVWDHFDEVLTLCDAVAEKGGKFHKILFPRHDVGEFWPSFWWSDERSRELLRRREAICMINGNKFSNVPGELYSKRREIAQWFNQNYIHIPFDVYGRPPFDLPNYKGIILPDGKQSILQRYKFSLCFENTNHPEMSRGYITEKILDCFEARTIPIYLGAANVEKIIPRGCFIDFRDFTDLKELGDYLSGISDAEYLRYVEDVDLCISAHAFDKYSCSEMYNKIVELCGGTEHYDGVEWWEKENTVHKIFYIPGQVFWTWEQLGAI